MSAAELPLARTPRPPYFAVIFTSLRSTADGEGYGRAALEMVDLAAEQPGYLGVESVRDSAGVGITVSYWSSLESIRAWGQVAAHRQVQAQGRALWYEQFRLRICRVEEERVFPEED
jgi:heme-degrading monooxygenase HmoA